MSVEIGKLIYAIRMLGLCPCCQMEYGLGLLLQASVVAF